MPTLPTVLTLRTRLTRRLVPGAILAALSVTVLTAGCGSSGSTATATTDYAQVVANAADATAKSGSARMALAINATQGSQNIAITGAGSYDYVAHRGALTVQLPADLGGSFAEIIDGDTLYIRIPQLSKKYYVLDVAKLTDGTGTFSQLGNADPSASLQLLRGAGADVTKVGTETIRDASTTHYRGTLDLSKAAAAAPTAVRQRLEAQFKTQKSVPFDAYIDDQGRLRKMTMHLTLDTASKVDSTVELFDFGTPVRITLPPKSQTQSGAPLLRLLQGGAQ